MKHKKKTRRYGGYWGVVGLLAVLVGLLGAVRFFKTETPPPVSETFSEIALPQALQVFRADFPNAYLGDYLAGLMARQNRDMNEIIRYYERVLEKDPAHEKLRTELYLMKAIQGRFDEMMPLVVQIAAEKKPELLADFVLVAESAKQGDYRQALDRLAQKAPYGLDSILGPVLRAWLKAGLGDKEAAAAALEPLKAEESLKAFYFYHQGLLALYFKDEQAAQESFAQLMRQETPSLTMFITLKDFYSRRADLKSLQQLAERGEKILKSNPAVAEIIRAVPARDGQSPARGIAEAFYDVSVALAPLKVEESSLIFNALSLYLDPDAVIPKIWGAEILESLEAYDQANDFYRAIAPQPEIVRLKSALNLFSLENYPEALAVFQELEQAGSSQPLIFSLMGDIYFRQERFDAARQSYRKAIEGLEKDGAAHEKAVAYFALGNTYEQLGQTPQAEEAYLKALENDPENPQILNHVGYAWLEQKKNTDEAFQLVQKAYALLPDDPNIMDSLAWGYYALADYPKALEWAEKSTDLIPYSAVANSHLGDIYRALGRRREAAYQYHKSLALTEDLTPQLQTELHHKLGELNEK